MRRLSLERDLQDRTPAARAFIETHDLHDESPFNGGQ